MTVEQTNTSEGAANGAATQAPAAAAERAAAAVKAEKEAREAFDASLRSVGLETEPEAEEEAETDSDPPLKKNTSKSKPRQDDDEDEVDEDDEKSLDDDEDGDEEDEDDEDEIEVDDDDDSSTKYERALRLLKLKHFTADDLKSLSKKRVIEIAERLRQDEATITKKLEAKAANDKAGDKAAGRPDAEDRTPAASKGLRAHATRLASVFDDEAAGAIIETLEGAAGEFESTLTEMREQFQKQVAELAEANTALRLDNFRARLQRRHPDLSEDLDDERNWRRMVKKMSALKGSGDYESADALADEALGIVFKDRVKQKQSHRDRDRGSLRAPTNRAKPPVEMTQDDAYRAAFEAAIDGDQKRLERVSRLRFR